MGSKYLYPYKLLWALLMRRPGAGLGLMTLWGAVLNLNEELVSPERAPNC